MKKTNPTTLTKYQEKRLTAKDFSRATRFSDVNKARKRQITARIDADFLLWLKSKGVRGYQSRLNAILCEAMTKEAQASGASEDHRR